MDETIAITRGRGKWSQSGVPHKGWVCVGEYDTFDELGEGELELCEMCETTQIRFVHLMKNERYHEQLKCGCICAGYMAEDWGAAESRDKQMRSRAGRRDNFPKRKAWRTSAKGTPYIKVEGYHLMVVAKSNGLFAVGATPPGSQKTIWGPRRYKSVEAAQKGCFDAWQHFESQ